MYVDDGSYDNIIAKTKGMNDKRLLVDCSLVDVETMSSEK